MENVKELVTKKNIESIRTNGDYDIISAVKISNDYEVVIGAKPDIYHPITRDGEEIYKYIEYVVWYCAYGKMYTLGIYHTEYKAAIDDLMERVKALTEYAIAD